MRRIAQTISYEIVLRTLIVIFAVLTYAFYFNAIKKLGSNIFLFYPLCFRFVILLLVFMIEINRTPFDLAECESELVSGFNVEYGGIEFSLIFLGENLIILVGSILAATIFLDQN